MASLGYTQLWGYDIDQNAEGRGLLEAHGITVLQGDLFQNSVPKDFFDCIRLEHVLEHLDRPLETIRRCYELLAPGGILLLSFPCIQSLAFNLTRSHYCALDLPRHVFHHTSSSAQILLEKAGFRHFSIRSTPDYRYLWYSTNHSLRAHGYPPLPKVLFFLLHPAYDVLSQALGLGDNIIVFAKKGVEGAPIDETESDTTHCQQPS